MINLKKYEWILVCLVTVVFLLQLAAFPGKSILFFLTTWSLALFYAIAGHSLFPLKNKEYSWISIVAGLAFGSSLFTWPFSIRMNNDPFYKICPVLNLFFFLGFSVFWIWKYRKEKDTNTGGLFLRSFSILTVTVFFSYQSVTSSAYRTALFALNNGNDILVANLQMYESKAGYEEALEKGDCDGAIVHANEANRYGKIWLGKIDSVSASSKVIAIEKGMEGDNEKWIAGTYTVLYKAYRCKAEAFYDSEHYKEALENYLIAHQHLHHFYDLIGHEEAEKAWSLNDLALTYSKLKEYAISDSLFEKSIVTFKKPDDYHLLLDVLTSKDSLPAPERSEAKNDTRLAIVYVNYARSLSDQNKRSHSTYFYKAANAILVSDTSDENKSSIVSNYNRIALNYIQQDSAWEAPAYLEKALQVKLNNGSSFCQTKFYYGIYHFKENHFLTADSIFSSCLSCKANNADLEDARLQEIYLWLAETNKVLAHYPKAVKYAESSLILAEKINGSNSVRYANTLRIYSLLNKTQSNYSTAQKQCQEALRIYLKTLGANNEKLPSVYLALSEIEMELSHYSSAKSYSDSASLEASLFYLPTSYALSGLLSNAAYLEYYQENYPQADKYFKSVLKLSRIHKKSASPSVADALNGLGLVEKEKRNFYKADSLFNLSLHLYQGTFSRDHPYVATLLLNQGNMYVEQGKLKEARQKLDEALRINKPFFSPKHDVFADLAVAFGDLEKNEKQPEKAKAHYQEALTLYKEKFEDNHLKIRRVKSKLAGN